MLAPRRVNFALHGMAHALHAQRVMHVAYAAVLLLLLTAGCVRHKPDTPVSVPPAVATQPARSQARR